MSTHVHTQVEKMASSFCVEVDVFEMDTELRGYHIYIDVW